MPRHLSRGVYSFFPFVCSFLPVTLMEFTSKFLVTVSLNDYISQLSAESMHIQRMGNRRSASMS